MGQDQYSGGRSVFVLLALLAVLPAMGGDAGLNPFEKRVYKINTVGDEVLDTQSLLIWRRCSEGQSWDGVGCKGGATNFKWEAALQHAQAMALATGVAWRLPSVEELASLLARASKPPMLNQGVFTNTQADWYWSASPYAPDHQYAWVVDFYTGTQGYDLTADGLGGAVRLVRTAGKTMAKVPSTPTDQVTWLDADRSH
jgi:hypothetical protein